MNKKTKAVTEEIKGLEGAILKGREYLKDGKHVDWQGFRPLFDDKWRDGRELPPHKDWVKNVFIPRCEQLLRKYQKALEKLQEVENKVGKEKQRRQERKNEVRGHNT